MRSAALLSLVLLGCGRAYELPRPVVRASRRAVLDDAAAACCVLAASALAAVPLAARADLADLDAVEGAAPVPMETVSSAPAIQMITLDAEGKKPKQLIATPGARIKELEAKKDKSEKEKKELRKLKSDEVCDAWTPTRPFIPLSHAWLACVVPTDVRDARKRMLTSSYGPSRSSWRLSTHCEYQDMYAVELHYCSEFNTRLVV